jgi:hypothetical protein
MNLQEEFYYRIDNDNGYDNKKLGDDLIAIAKNHLSKQFVMSGVRFSLPTDPMKLAEYLHNSYELIAKKTNWNTQESCKVKFKDLPSENKTTMILLAGKLILDFVGNET